MACKMMTNSNCNVSAILHSCTTPLSCTSHHQTNCINVSSICTHTSTSQQVYPFPKPSTYFSNLSKKKKSISQTHLPDGPAMEMEHSHLLPVVLALSLVFLYSLLLKYSTRVARKLNIPLVAGGAWPIIGHLHLLRGASKPAHIVLGKMADKYGPIFTMKMGLKRTVVISNSHYY